MISSVIMLLCFEIANCVFLMRFLIPCEGMFMRLFWCDLVSWERAEGGVAEGLMIE